MTAVDEVKGPRLVNDDSQPASEAPPVDAPVEDRIVDRLLPGLDWAMLVRTYPLSAVRAVALGGFLIGRLRGADVLSKALDVATVRASETVDRLLELEPDDFRG